MPASADMISGRKKPIGFGRHGLSGQVNRQGFGRTRGTER
jgi:hypothetical protein